MSLDYDIISDIYSCFSVWFNSCEQGQSVHWYLLTVSTAFCAYVNVPPSLFVRVCVCVCLLWVSVGQWSTHPYKACREPSFLLVNLAPPPVLIGGVQHLDDITGLKRQLPVRHGHVVPYCLGIDDWTPTYQLYEWRRGERRHLMFYSRHVKP